MTELETYNHILASASALIASKGFAATSMNDIIKASGLSKGGVYWHFKSKDDIIHAIVGRIFDEQMAFLQTILSEDGSATERIKHLMQLIATSLNEPEVAVPSPVDVYALMLRDDILLQGLRDYFGQYQQILAKLITRGVQNGEFDTEQPAQVALVFMSTIEGILLVHDVMGETAQLSTLINQSTNLFLNGLLIKEDK